MKSPKTLSDLLEKHGVSVRIPGQLGPGWLPMLDRLLKRLISLGWNRRAAQVKEKFGALRFYVDGPVTRKISDAISRAEVRSLKICEVCGRSGSRQAICGWWLTRCPACLAAEKKKNAGS